MTHFGNLERVCMCGRMRQGNGMSKKIGRETQKGCGGQAHTKIRDRRSTMSSRTHRVENDQLQYDLILIEKMLKKQLEELGEAIPTFQDTEELENLEDSTSSEIISLRIKSMVRQHSRAEELLLKEVRRLKKQLNDQRFFIEEIETERDVLLQQIHAYLETNSSLRVRLEEQRCQSGSVQRQQDLESRIKVLENEKEKLYDMNVVKENEIRRINLLLEQTASRRKHKEAEMTFRKNEENRLISTLKADLKKALEERACLEDKYVSLKECVEDYFLDKSVEWFMRRKRSVRRSRSMGDMHWEKLSSLERSIALESPEGPPNTGFRQRLKNTSKAESNSEAPLPKPWSPQSQSRAVSVPSSPAGPPVHTQLNALKRDLMNVTRKLESLKCQLLVSGAIEEEPKKGENRNLKRKATPMEEPSSAEEQNLEFKNLKNILQDAKNLNVKLQNLRDEKQKIIDLNRKEAGVQATVKNETRKRSFQRAVMTLKKAVNDCEEKLDGGVITEEEAFAGLVSPFYACILSNSRCFHECRRRTGSEFNDETDTESLMDDGSTGVSSPGEDGGGDNLLKKQISNRGLDCGELKSQTAHLKCKIEQEI